MHGACQEHVPSICWATVLYLVPTHSTCILSPASNQHRFGEMLSEESVASGYAAQFSNVDDAEHLCLRLSHAHPIRL